MVVGKQMVRAGAGLGLWVAHAVASAQAVIVYAPAKAGSAAVPTLSEWGMLGLALMLGAWAFVALRKGERGQQVLGLALATTVAVGAGTATLREAWAASLTPLEMTVPTGGSITTGEGSVQTPVVNQTGVMQRIISITPSTAIDPATSGCIPGVTVVGPSSSCTVLVAAVGPKL